MQKNSIIVRADWDDEAGVWVATTGDIDGLVAEAETLEQLSEKVCAAIIDLVGLNGFSRNSTEIPVHLIAHKLIRVPVDCAV